MSSDHRKPMTRRPFPTDSKSDNSRFISGKEIFSIGFNNVCPIVFFFEFGEARVEETGTALVDGVEGGGGGVDEIDEIFCVGFGHGGFLWFSCCCC